MTEGPFSAITGPSLQTEKPANAGFLIFRYRQKETFIGWIKKGFDFLGYRISPNSLLPATRTLFGRTFNRQVDLLLMNCSQARYESPAMRRPSIKCRRSFSSLNGSDLSMR